MKYSTGLAALGLVGGVVSAQAHAPHGHVHRHADKHVGAPVEKRADATTWVAAVETIYELDGKVLSPADVEAGISKGIYVLIAEPTTSKPAPAEFFQKTTTTSSSSTPTTTSTPPPAPEPTTTSTTPVAVPTTSSTPASSPAASSGSSSDSTPGGSGVTSKFPSGKIPCSHFPSDYGAMEVDWMGLGGWSGVQQPSGYSPGAAAISDIVTVIKGMGGCTSGCFCSYACPAGYQKVHWPTAQGSTGQSVGGLWCNADGMLELTNPDYDTLCGAGTGEVKVTNNLSQNVAICRTDYPGTESETVPLDTQPGQTYELTCPDANKYYMWGGKPTSAQYYINPAGVPVEEACIWGDGSTQTGNWAPINLGVGKGAGGETFISMFWNRPTNPNPSLAYTIEIQGGISGTCKFSGGTFYSNGVANPNGCTVSVQGVATYVLS